MTALATGTDRPVWKRPADSFEVNESLADFHRALHKWREDNVKGYREVAAFIDLDPHIPDERMRERCERLLVLRRAEQHRIIGLLRKWSKDCEDQSGHLLLDAADLIEDGKDEWDNA